MNNSLQVKLLTPQAIVTLGQLFGNGPTWEGYIISKPGRDLLMELGLAARTDGWSYLTEGGVQLAAEWDRRTISSASNTSWFRKLMQVPRHV